ncbi:MAG: PilZ domain-containing protein [Archangium sp.]|nr:PilZ domain-containing protein [Archangium sp.]
MSANRRTFFRVRASLRFTFAWEGGFELFRTVDVSACGAFVMRHVPAGAMPGLGAEGECAFNLESMEIRVAAKVVRVASNGFAVRFRAVPRTQEDRICGWAFRQETRKEPFLGE